MTGVTENPDRKTSLIRRLHKSPWKMVLAVTGGGSGVIGDLLSVPGGSQTLLEAIVPYSTESLCQFLRTVPEQYCSEKTARLMAMSAFLRAIQLNSVNPPADTSGLGGSTGPTDPSGSTDLTCPPNLAGFCEERDFLMGVGITASLVSDRPKRGEHRIYLAIQTLRQTLTCSLILKKGERSRIEEEHVVQNMLFSLLELRLTGEFEEETDSVSCHCVKLAGHQQGWFSCQKELWSCKDETSVDHPVWQEEGGKEGQNEETREIPLLEWASGSGILSQLVFGADKKTRPVIQGVRWLNHSLEVVKNRKNRPVILLPGSFNPIHHGHIQMLQIAESVLGKPGALELSIHNVDKPPLDFLDISRRLSDIQKALPNTPVWITQLPQFVQKSEYFKSVCFLCGIDTVVRIANPKYYDGKKSACMAVLRKICRRNSHFIVFARTEAGRTQSLSTVRLPRFFVKICQEIPASTFLEDVSSTAIRAANRHH